MSDTWLPDSELEHLRDVASMDGHRVSITIDWLRALIREVDERRRLRSASCGCNAGGMCRCEFRDGDWQRADGGR